MTFHRTIKSALTTTHRTHQWIYAWYKISVRANLNPDPCWDLAAPTASRTILSNGPHNQYSTIGGLPTGGSLAAGVTEWGSLAAEGNPNRYTWPLQVHRPNRSATPAGRSKTLNKRTIRIKEETYICSDCFCPK